MLAPEALPYHRRDASLAPRPVTGVRKIARGISGLARSGGGAAPPARNEPPATPPGWIVAPPDFVGVGTARSGTTWWDELIHTHPLVHRAEGVPKEVHFFDRFWDGSYREADAATYARFFPRPAGGRAGEWTPGYMIDFWAPALIHRAAPEARILILLRDPVERYRSSMAHTEELSRSPLDRLGAMGAFQRGLYSQQLRRVFRALPHDQVLILQYERCRADPAAELARTFDFLGLRPFSPPASAFERPVNPTTGHKLELSAALRATLAAAYAPDLAELAALAPEIDLALWPTVRAAPRVASDHG